jgi:tetratricopeptide (TPR) repeat protein
MGDFERAFEAYGHAHALGEVRGDVRLQTYTDWSSGWLLAIQGDWEEAIAACQRSLEQSRDRFNTIMATGMLGLAYLAHGDLAQGVPRVEWTSQQFSQIGYWPLVSWFHAWMSEALRLHHAYEKARDVAMQALDIGSKAKNPYGVAYAQRVLGQIAQASDALTEAHPPLGEALKTFAAIQSRFEMGCTHLALAELAHAQGNRDAATAHANNAHALFMALKTPRDVERTQQFASACGLELSSADTLRPEQRSSETLR